MATAGGVTITGPTVPPAPAPPLPPGTEVPGGFIQPSGGFAPTSGPGFPTNPTPFTPDTPTFTLPPANVTNTPVGGLPASQIPFPVIGGGPTPPQFVSGPVPTFGGVPIVPTPAGTSAGPGFVVTGDATGGSGAAADVNSTFAVGLQPGGAVEGNTGGFDATTLQLSPDLTASQPPDFTSAVTPPNDQGLPVSPDIGSLGVGTGAVGTPGFDVTQGQAIPGVSSIPGISIPGSPIPTTSGGGAGFWQDVINVMQRVGLVLVGIVLLGAAAYAMSQTDIQSRTRAAFT